MTTTITAQDGTADTTIPLVMVGFAPTAESGNIIHNLIAPGTIAVTLAGDYPRSGSFRLVYDNDTDAEVARLLLGRSTWFTVVDTDRPVVDMTFVRAGQITTAVHDEILNVWEFEVGYQETP